MKIYVAYPLSTTERELLNSVKSQGDEWMIAQDIKDTDRQRAFEQAEVVFGNIPPEWIKNHIDLRWLQLASTGFNAYLTIDWKAFSNVLVSNLRDFYGQPVAETAVAGIMAFYRKIDELANLKTEEKWVGAALRPHLSLLHKKNVVLLGGGAIGEIIHKILQGFSCQVTIIRKSQSPTLEDMDRFLPGADILISTLPESPETIGILDKKRIALLKKDALFVNVGRGSVIDEEALVEALSQSKIKGAVLDVTYVEPIPSSHMLWKLPNVILTQHTGGGFIGEKTEVVRVFVENLKLYRSGNVPESLIDFDKGY